MTDKISHERTGGVDNQFEVLDKLMVIHGGDLRKNITSDYTMAHLNLDDQIYIKETYENAGFVKFIIEKIADRSFSYKWDNEKQTYILDESKKPKKIRLNEDEKRFIKLNAKYLFDSLMISPDMLVILKRNDSQNHLLNILGNIKEIDDDGNEKIELNEQKGMINKLKEKLRSSND